MKSQYFCIFHAQLLQARESEAIAAWSQLMRRGMTAYNECRTSDAYTYLGAALDLALLRSECASNGIFSELHLIKPAEFLIQLQLAEQRFDDATLLLDRLGAFGNLPIAWLGPTLEQFVEFERSQINAVKAREPAIPSDRKLSYQAAVIPLRH